MKRNVRMLIGGFLLGCASFVFAQVSHANQPAATLSACEKNWKSDGQLNASYQRVMKCLGDGNRSGEAGEYDKQRQASLKKSQLTWLKYRDAQANFVASGFEGGTGQSETYADALADVTATRVKQLNEIYKDEQCEYSQ